MVDKKKEAIEQKGAGIIYKKNTRIQGKLSIVPFDLPLVKDNRLKRFKS